VLIERNEEIGFVACGEDLARAHADLENGRAAGDGGRDRHVGHDLLRTASGQPREESAGTLNAVLRIPGKADYSIVDGLRPKIGAARCWTGSSGSAVCGIGFGRDRRRIHLRNTVSKAQRESTGENSEWPIERLKQKETSKPPLPKQLLHPTSSASFVHSNALACARLRPSGGEREKNV